MALHHRREAPVRPRFLLALTLSTVTALAVGAPLALQANRNSQNTSYAAGPSGSSQSNEDDAVASPMNGHNLSGEGLGRGGIVAETESKAKAQALSPKSAEVTVTTDTAASSPESSVADSSSTTAVDSSTTVAASSTASSGSTTSTTSGASSSSSSSSSTSTTVATTTTSTTRPTTSSSSTTSRPATTTSAAVTSAPTSAPDAQATSG